MKILRSKLYEIESRKQHEKIAGERKSQVGTGDRSERSAPITIPREGSPTTVSDCRSIPLTVSLTGRSAKCWMPLLPPMPPKK